MTPHFKLSELIYSDTAKKMGNANTPTPEHLKNLQVTACQMEIVRTILGNKPIQVTSGYRNPVVNRAVGGVANSDHALGFAIDFHCYGFGSDYEVARAIAASNLQFDQLIYERKVGYSLVHISFNPRMRRQLLTEVTTPTRKWTENGINK